jgi:outer membrane protein OmpA-like peptidoglycan-associated protein
MKKLLLLLFLSFGCSFAQNSNQDNALISNNSEALSFKFALNAIHNRGNQAAFGNFKELAFKSPYLFELEYRFSPYLSFNAGISHNEWRAGEGLIDEIVVDSDTSYDAIDLGLNYYFGKSISWLDNYSWFEPYIHAGVGYFFIETYGSDGSFNAGPGLNIWLSDNVGIGLMAKGRWSFEHEFGTSNHIQFSTGIILKLSNKDYDNDGVKNKEDECPYVFGIMVNNGCPEVEDEVVILDTDNDGLVDVEDSCPNSAGPIENKGCPYPDSDNDGVRDNIDQCPTVSGLLANNGCPEDSDKDGVPDNQDECPDVYGLTSNKGCPHQIIEIGAVDNIVNAEIEAILFQSSSAELDADAIKILNKTVDIIKQHTDAIYKIEGHTDSTGNKLRNKKLSEERAESVRNYLVKQGFPESKLLTEGFGDSKPISSNLTREGRKQNRRINIIRLQ